MWQTKRIVLYAMLILASIKAAAIAEDEARILHFPRDRSLGLIVVKDADSIEGQIPQKNWFQKSECFSEAQGDVIIPSGKIVALLVNRDAIKDLSPLLNLKPDDLYMLSQLTGAWDENYPLSNKGMKHISHLTGLKGLWLQQTRTTTQGIEHITKLQSLELLAPPKRLTNKGLSYVAELKSLRDLHLMDYDRITNVGLNRCLPRLTTLEKLTLRGEQMSDDGLVSLEKLPMLHSLSIRYANFTDKGMVHVKKCTSLRNLDLIRLPITDVGAYQLSSLTKLEELDLAKTDVTDRGLGYLKSLLYLKKLYFPRKLTLV